MPRKKLWHGVNVDELPIFPYEIKRADDIPGFVERFLNSGYTVNWLDFDVWDLWVVRDFLLQLKNKSGYEELYDFLLWDEEYGYKDKKYFQRAEYDPFGEMKYSASQIGSLLKLISPVVDPIKAFHRKHCRYPFNLTIDFNLPPFPKNNKIPSETIINQIRSYGGNIQQIRQYLHFSNSEWRSCRGSLHIEFPDLISEFIRKTIPGRRIILLPVNDSRVSSKTRVEAEISYPPDFTGYFLYTFDCIAADLGPK